MKEKEKGEIIQKIQLYYINFHAVIDAQGTEKYLKSVKLND